MANEFRKLVELELYESYSRYGGLIPGKILENNDFLHLFEVMTKIIAYIIDLDIDNRLSFKCEAARIIKTTYVKYYVLHNISTHLPFKIKEVWELYDRYESDPKFIELASICTLENEFMINLAKSMLSIYEISLRLLNVSMIPSRIDIEFDTCYDMINDMEKLCIIPKTVTKYLLKLKKLYKIDDISKYELLNQLNKSKSMWSLRTADSIKSTSSLRTTIFIDELCFVGDCNGELKLNLSLRNIKNEKIKKYRNVLRKIFVQLILDVIRYYKLRYHFDYVKNSSLKYSRLTESIRYKCDHDINLIKKTLNFINFIK